MRLWAPIVVLPLLLTLGSSPPPQKTPVRYELTAQTKDRFRSGQAEIARGGPGFETTYAFYAVFADGTKTLEWRRREENKYIAHWITRSGRVWIMAGTGWTGPMDFGSFSLRDRNGDVLGSWTPGLYPAARERVRARQVVKEKTQAATLRNGDLEEIAVPFTDGTQERYIAFWPKGAQVPVCAVAHANKKDDLLAETLTNPAYELPAIQPPFGFWNHFRFWVAKPTDGKGVERVWIVPQQDRLVSQIVRLDQVHQFNKVPDAAYSVFGLTLLFEFGDRTATLSFVDGLAGIRHVTNLVTLGGFKSAAEAKADLEWQSPLILAMSGWMPIRQMGMSDYSRNQIEILDRRGKHYILVLDPQTYAVKERAYAGLIASRPIDASEDESATVTSERNARSKSGVYHLRFRRYEAKNVKFKGGAMTLSLLTTVDGKPGEVQLWSRPCYMDVPFMGVTDSGRVVYFESGLQKTYGQNDSIGHMADYGTLWIFGADGQEEGGQQVIGGNWGISDLAQMSRAIDFGHVRLESIGTPAVETAGDRRIQVWPVEEITVPIKGGKSKVFYILAHASAGDNMVFDDQPWIDEYVKEVRGQR
ncbi:MAG TPA: hypothetical protein VMI31_12505 [Fimbriimonadaceae bacterium]|nr:hypothetical protein [Fimbriimonadaceae bacterium]